MNFLLFFGHFLQHLQIIHFDPYAYLSSLLLIIKDIAIRDIANIYRNGNIFYHPFFLLILLKI